MEQGTVVALYLYPAGRGTQAEQSSWPLEAMYRMGLFALNEIGRAYTGKAPVVWSSAFFPAELAWGLDLCPFSPEVAAAYIA